MSEFFDVSLDVLIKDDDFENLQEVKVERVERGNGFNPWFRGGYEYKSESMLWGMPIVHVNVGFGRKAKGVIAFGLVANGIVSLGLLSVGVASVGLLSLGVLSFGVFAIGLLLALGAISIGVIAVGAIAFGLLSFGAIAIGMYAQGAFAVASRVAVGDRAHGYIAVGQTVVNGIREFLSPTGALSDISQDEVRVAMNEAFPNTWNWTVNLMTMWLRR